MTETLIKDACLLELRQTDYTHITISNICRIANISRRTFIDAMSLFPWSSTLYSTISCDDILKSISTVHEHLIESGVGCKAPLCQSIRENDKNSSILVDPVISDIFIAYAAESRIDSMTDDRTDLSEAQKRSLKEFLLSGCVYMIRKNLRANEGKWDHIKCAIDGFVRNGYG